jgi:D-alanyl-D-alanine carboxypeptidase
MVKKVFSLASLSLCAIGFSQSIDSKKLDNYFDTLSANHKVMGSFAVSKDDKIVYKKSIGFADAENNKLANENTVYRIGSVSKTFTAVLVMKAVEENKLKLTDKLSNYFPEVKNADKITIENLLQHRSGVHNFTQDEDFLPNSFRPYSQKEILGIIVKVGSDFEPGTKYSYSNSNYTLLALILEKIYKKSYSNLLSEKITKPLQLTKTEVGGKIKSDKNEANSYSYFAFKYDKQKETDMSVTLGAGDLISTPSELLKFIIALENGKLVSNESLEKMKTFNEGYGFALFPVSFSGKKGFGHNGAIDMFHANLFYFKDSKTAFASLTNQFDYYDTDLSLTIMKAAFGMNFDIPSFKVIEVSQDILKKYVGHYSNPTFPLQIDVFVENGKLMAQASGQGSFPLEATSENSFKFDEAAITFDFNAEKNEMHYRQLGQDLIFKKEQK